MCQNSKRSRHWGHGDICVKYHPRVVFSTRCNIYTSRAYATMPVSVCLFVCLWRLCTVVTGCNGSRISLHAWIDGCLCYLLTMPHPDCRMGWCRDFQWKRGVWKNCDCSDITYFTYFLSMDRKHVTVRFVYINIFVISVENALCLKTVRLITTSA